MTISKQVAAWQTLEARAVDLARRAAISANSERCERYLKLSDYCMQRWLKLAQQRGLYKYMQPEYAVHIRF